MIKITIDTNLINVQGKVEEMNIIERWHSEKIIEIVGSQKLFEEMGDPTGEAYQKASGYQNIFEPFSVGMSAIGSSFIGKGEPKFKDIARILFPNIKDMNLLNSNQSNDIMHLLAHSASDSSVFITNDSKDYLHSSRKLKDYSKQKRLRDEFNILVMNPKEAISYLQELLEATK